MATEQPENPCAFPSGDFIGVEPGYGMTLRDWFAGQALPQAVAIADAADIEGTNEELAIGVANLSYLIADAMLNARRAAIARATGEA